MQDRINFLQSLPTEFSNPGKPVVLGVFLTSVSSYPSKFLKDCVILARLPIWAIFHFGDVSICFSTIIFLDPSRGFCLCGPPDFSLFVTLPPRCCSKNMCGSSSKSWTSFLMSLSRIGRLLCFFSTTITVVFFSL